MKQLLLTITMLAMALTAQASQRQSTPPAGFNPHALDGWEVIKPKFSNWAMPDGELTVSARKALREGSALQLKSILAASTKMNVSLDGADHDKLVVSFGNTNPSIAKLAEALQVTKADFWKLMRFLKFSEVVLTGAGHYESFPASKFTQWTRGYDEDVSAMISAMGAMYKGQLFGEGGARENPVAQRTIRQQFASTLDGEFKSIYSGLQVRLEGENDDKLVIHLPQLNVQNYDILLRSLRGESNFWNYLRVVGFSEVIWRGSNYWLSIPRKEFIPWCRNYEKFLAEAQRSQGQYLRALQHEATQPAP